MGGSSAGVQNISLVNIGKIARTLKVKPVDIFRGARLGDRGNAKDYSRSLNQFTEARVGFELANEARLGFGTCYW